MRGYSLDEAFFDKSYKQTVNNTNNNKLSSGVNNDLYSINTNTNTKQYNDHLYSHGHRDPMSSGHRDPMSSGHMCHNCNKYKTKYKEQKYRLSQSGGGFNKDNQLSINIILGAVIILLFNL